MFLVSGESYTGGESNPLPARRGVVQHKGRKPTVVYVWRATDEMPELAARFGITAIPTRMASGLVWAVLFGQWVVKIFLSQKAFDRNSNVRFPK